MPDNDTRFPTPDAVEQAFYSAFAATDLGAMARVWAVELEDIRCIHPGSDLLTGADVLQSWRQIFAGTHAPTVRHRVLDRSPSTELSVHLVEERIGPSDASASGLTRVLATNVYRLTDSGWRMILHHATLPLVENESGPRDAAPASGGRQLH
jgi:ketosteroid isomerase-like protein